MRETSYILITLSVILSGCSDSHTESVSVPEQLQVVETSSYPQNWENAFNRFDLSKKALEQTSAFYSENVWLENPNIIYSIKPGIDQERALECVVNPAMQMIAAFSSELPESFMEEDYYLLFGQGDWLVQEVENVPIDDWPVQTDKNGYPQDFLGWLRRSDFPTVTYEIAGTAEENLIIMAANQHHLSQSCSEMIHISYHEAFHMVHLELDGRSQMGFTYEEKPFFGLWFVEGSADFFAKSLNNFVSGAKYHGTSPKLYDGALADHVAVDSSEQVYSHGQLAIEFIVANVGVDPVLEVFRELKNGNDFESAFELGIGMSTDEFYKKYDAMQISY